MILQFFTFFSIRAHVYNTVRTTEARAVNRLDTSKITPFCGENFVVKHSLQWVGKINRAKVNFECDDSYLN